MKIVISGTCSKGSRAPAPVLGKDSKAGEDSIEDWAAPTDFHWL